MSKLQSLTAFVQGNLPQRLRKLEFNSDMDELRFIPAQRDLGLDQYQLALMQFDAVLSWGRFPYRDYDPRNLCALLLVWMIENGPDYGPEPELPSIDIDVIDDKTAMVVVSMAITESLSIKQDEAGDIPFQGAKWRLTDPQLWLATEGAIFGADAQGAPIGEHG
ncbi:tail terminator [Yersinia phage vB_YenM_324]|uniref:tail terminator n=1 Tax=Yersinia phage vB_YenM_324 TaxID=2914024 RepID=UPI0023290D0B|nr:tail terminator [Yersinia phage vB_YenM_324]UKL54205.1 tail protein [Yersinia phage vB_YenM_324]HDL6872290.1 phage tail protein [Yersinia enterocolitica]HDL6888853.1 phage tail protein [Yersinia enterocolitica]HDL7629654.1 phage tail protein [Yersinia enterocolitica]